MHAVSNAIDEITVLICDSTEIARTGIERAITEATQYKVIGFAADGIDAVKKTASLKPRVVVLEIEMPRLDGIEATRQIKLASPQTRVLLLSNVANDETLFAALASGADGYCLKEAPVRNFLQALEALASGAAWLDPGLAMRVLRNTSQPGTATHQRIVLGGGADKKFRLSAREIEVLQCLVEGLSNREIAERFTLGAETVKTHVRHILEKLSVSDRTQAAVKALREGLLERIPPPAS